MEGGVPVVRDGLEKVLHIEHGLRIESDEAFAAGSSDMDHAGPLEDVEVLGDGLAGKARAFGELGDGAALAAPQAGEQRQASFIAQRCEDGGACRD
jgi:hypothetical protein